jgi:diaminohydroxyphosphoribosylaminopyrimidine deaminase/5-amino-6-(5-phosphoribosylamino)uracil reductase
MGLALRLAARGLGRVWPNPAVGCVIVDREGHVVGRGWTQDGGRPHAETEAIRSAGTRAEGATAFVTLEPCAHHGQTGPCAEALTNAKISRVVSAVEDPDARVAGRGHEMLRKAGVVVRVGVLQAQAQELNAGFFSRVQRGRPFVTLKLATTLDGKIALKSGQSQWITGEAARRHSHLMRAQHDAVMVGIGTALADDPELTCRLPGLEHRRLVRIVVDSAGRLPVASKLVASASKQAVWLLTQVDAPQLSERNVKVLSTGSSADGVSLQSGLTLLAKEGLTRVMVEGGAKLASSLLKYGLVDQLLWYRAPTVMGEGASAVSDLGLTLLGELPRFIRKETIRLGEDVLETYRIAT